MMCLNIECSDCMARVACDDLRFAEKTMDELKTQYKKAGDHYGYIKERFAQMQSVQRQMTKEKLEKEMRCKNKVPAKTDNRLYILST